MGYRYFLPKERKQSPVGLSPKRLKRSGYQAVILDLDNTIVPWSGEKVPGEIAGWVTGAKAEGLKICIVSNSAFRTNRAKAVAGFLNVPLVVHALKPLPFGLKKALKKLGVEAGKTVLVGDQLFTDILGGNLMGFYTVLVAPLDQKEFFTTRISRLLEKLVFRHISAPDHSGCNGVDMQNEKF